MEASSSGTLANEIIYFRTHLQECGGHGANNTENFFLCECHLIKLLSTLFSLCLTHPNPLPQGLSSETHINSINLYITSRASRTQKYMGIQKYSHGRGGAGNIATTTVEYVDGLAYSPPILRPENTKHFTTGRGGAGNICKYDPQKVRIAQGVPDGPGRIPRATQAGRGGVGNLQAAKKRETMRRQSMAVPEARKSHESADNVLTATQSNDSVSSTISESGIADWAKNKLFGRRRNSNNV